MPVGLGYTEATDNGGATSSLTTAGGTTSVSGSTFYVLVVTRISAVAPTVSDNMGNTYGSPLVSYTTGFNDVYEFACINGTGGAGHTVTVSFGVTTGSIVLAFAEFTGVGAGTVDATPAGLSGSFGTSGTAPSITTTVANELVINGLSLYSGGSSGVASTGSGFTLAISYTSLLGAAISYAIPASSSTAAADTYTWTGGNFFDAVGLSIIPASGGSSASFPPVPGSPNVLPGFQQHNALMVN